MIIGYLDEKDKNIASKEQQKLIIDYACSNSLTVDLILSDTAISTLKDQIRTGGHTILVANVLALGDSLLQIIDSIEFLNGNNNSVISVMEGFAFASGQDTQSLVKGLRLAYDIRSSLTSVTTRKTLAAKKIEGQKLGRPFGSVGHSSATRKYKDIVLKALAAGMTKRKIAQQLQISERTVYNIVKVAGAV